MSCNGKLYPFMSDLNFNLVAFGSNQKGKLIVESSYDKANSQWSLNKIDLKTIDKVTKIL